MKKSKVMTTCVKKRALTNKRAQPARYIHTSSRAIIQKRRHKIIHTLFLKEECFDLHDVVSKAVKFFPSPTFSCAPEKVNLDSPVK